jgi:hypothetical protein
MARGKTDHNVGILEYALRHLEHEREELQEKIDHILRQLGIRSATPAKAPASSASSASSASAAAAAPAAAGTPGRAKRVLSAAARKRIAAAQRKRWAEHRKGLKTTARKGA